MYLVCCHFALVAFNLLSLSLTFVILITVCLSVFLLGFILLGTLCFLDLVGYFFSHVGEVFSYYLLKYFLGSSLSLSPSGTPIMRMLSQRSLKLTSFFFFLNILFCGSECHHSVLQVTY